jgi:MFS family permease
MYSETDLEAAVTAGVLSPEAANAFRNHVSTSRSSPLVDEESFRLLTGFNDIFVSIALTLLLTALAWIGGSITPWLGGAAVAAASWMLAEYFTRQRRMALPSILLLLSFVGGVAGTLIGLMSIIDPDLPDQVDALIAAGIGLCSAVAAWFHWRRFQVPITVAAGAVALVGVTVALMLSVNTALGDYIPALALVGGLGLFAAAMWWDTSDRTRQTRRADVAFWLHLAAAPMIAHSVFHMLGVLDGRISAGQATLVIALYVLFAIVSLAVDRRALLVSSLAYVLYAMNSLVEKYGSVSLGQAITFLVIGSALLMLSAFWHPVRRTLVQQLPTSMRGYLPLTDKLTSLQPAS